MRVFAGLWHQRHVNGSPLDLPNHSGLSARKLTELVVVVSCSRTTRKMQNCSGDYSPAPQALHGINAPQALRGSHDASQ